MADEFPVPSQLINVRWAHWRCMPYAPRAPGTFLPKFSLPRRMRHNWRKCDWGITANHHFPLSPIESNHTLCQLAGCPVSLFKCSYVWEMWLALTFTHMWGWGEAWLATCLHFCQELDCLLVAWGTIFVFMLYYSMNRCIKYRRPTLGVCGVLPMHPWY